MADANVGDMIRCAVSFTTAGGTPADPTTVTAKYETPRGELTSYTYGGGQIVKDSTGNYHMDITCTEGGKWHYRFAGTGAVVAAAEGEFEVQMARMA